MKKKPPMTAEYCVGLRDVVDHLATHDPDWQIFGARAHRYRFRAPCSPSRLRQIEKKYALDLPADYAAFVTTCGDGGAGPYHGLLPLDTPRQLACLVGEFSPTEAWNVAPDAAGYAKFKSDAAASGTLPLAHLGCTYFALLVAKGPSKGQVWFDFRSADQGLVPTYGSFRDFFSHWCGAVSKGRTIEQRLEPGGCGLPRALDAWRAQWAEKCSISPQKMTKKQLRECLGEIPDGAIALRSSPADRYFDDGDPVDVCPGCHDLVSQHVADGAMRWSQLVPGIAPPALRQR